MGEIIYLKLLPIIVSIAILVCYLTESTQDIKNMQDSTIEEIENWLNKITEEEVAFRKPKPVEDDAATSPSPVPEEVVVDNLVDDKGLSIEGVNHAEEFDGDIQSNSETSPIPDNESFSDDMDDYYDYGNNSSYDDCSNGEISSKDEDLIYESSFTMWHVNVTHQAAKLLKENKEILETHNKTALRLLHLYSMEGALYHSEPKHREELRKTKKNMLKKFLETIATESKTCPQRPHVYKLDLKPQVCSVLKCIWESWHNEVGMAVRNEFEKMVELSNKAAQENGYNDAGEVWKIDDVEDLNAEKEMKRLLDGVMPLYEQLHAYVRRKVFSYYCNDMSCGNQPEPDEPIPAHLIGNLNGLHWTELDSLVLPYPDATLLNFTKIMISLKLDQNHMAREADKFFISLGFRPMTEKFWQKSTFNATGGSGLGCIGRTYKRLDEGDYEMFMCASLTLKDFVTLHQLMGHILTYMEKEQLPYKFRNKVNNIFSEGLGDCLGLSVSTPDHLEKIFNISNGDRIENPGDTNKKRDINALIRSALYILPLLPYSYVLEMWRYQVFSGNITPEEYNRSWWKMKATYQGIAPPSKRPKDNFDPGSIIHVAYNEPYGKYFFSLFVAFQMHEALCKISKHEGPLHHCDIYQSTDAGHMLRGILKQGGSKTTLELLKELTGNNGYKYEPIIEYYKPLYEWLQKENKGHIVGWKKNFNVE